MRMVMRDDEDDGEDGGDDEDDGDCDGDDGDGDHGVMMLMGRGASKKGGWRPRVLRIDLFIPFPFV